MDVSLTFLNAILNDFLYVKNPPGNTNVLPKGNSIMIIMARYGLKTA